MASSAWGLEKFHRTLNEKTLFSQRKGLPFNVVECVCVCVCIPLCVCVFHCVCVYSIVCVCVCVCSICRHTQWDTAYQTFFIHSSSMDIKLLLCFLSVEITSFASMWIGLEIVNYVTIVNYCKLDGKRQI